MDIPHRHSLNLQTTNNRYLASARNKNFFKNALENFQIRGRPPFFHGYISIKSVFMYILTRSSPREREFNG